MYVNFYFRLCPYLYDLAHMNPENAETYIQEVLKEKHNKFEKNKMRYPDMNTVRLYIHLQLHILISRYYIFVYLCACMQTYVCVRACTCVCVLERR